MELIDLKVFTAVVAEGTTTKAAKKLGMTQPGVSKHLARLEQNVGGKLFNREGKYLAINEFGECLHEKVKKILGAVDELSECSYDALVPAGSFSFGLTDAATLFVKPSSLLEFRRRYPRIHLSFDVDSSMHIEDGVLNSRYDIGIVTAPQKPHPMLEQDVLCEDCIDAMVAFDNPLAKKKRVTLNDIAQYPLIISPRRRRTRSIIDGVFKSTRITPKDTIEVYLQTAAVRLAEVGLGVALLPRAFIVRELHRSNCAHVMIADNPITRRLSIIRKKGTPLSESANFFYSTILKRT